MLYTLSFNGVILNSTLDECIHRNAALLLKPGGFALAWPYKACLLESNAVRLVVVAVHDSLLVHDGTSHVAALANIHERAAVVLQVPVGTEITPLSERQYGFTTRER